MPTVLITGTSRGIGREYARQYAADGWSVIATARRPDASSSSPGVEQIALDVSDSASVEALARQLDGRPIDVLINNAGVLGSQGLGSVEAGDFINHCRINALAPLLVTQALLPNLLAGSRKVVANMTSRMGSIADNSSGGYYAYRASKAALNAVSRSLALDLRPHGITCFVLHPGWVKTAMGGAGAILEPRDSVAGLRRIIDGAGLAQSGRFFNYDGSELPW